MPKLLILNAAKNYGSTGKISEQIGLLAINKGWEVCISHSARYENPSNLKSLTTGSKSGEKIHALMAYAFDRQGLHSKSATKKLIESIKGYAPDIIHLHNIHGYYLNYPMLFSYLAEANIPIVWTMHDCWSFTGHCSYFDMIGCDKWKTHCNHCQNLSDYPKAILDRSYKNFEQKRTLFTGVKNCTLVPVSEWLGEMASQSFMGKFPIHVIHNGIDLSVFRRKGNEVRERLNIQDKFIVLGVSSNGFTGRKGLNDFVRLSQILPSTFQIVMVGLKKEEKKLLPDNIIGMSRTANVEELVDLYNAADVFINPTYSDNFPTTNIEALACGTPVVTYRTGGSPEAIDRNTGVVVAQGNVSELANAIQYLCSMPLSSNKCRKRAEDYFDMNKCFEQYIDMYNSIRK